MFVVVSRPAPVALLPEELVGDLAPGSKLRDAALYCIAGTGIAKAVDHRQDTGRTRPCEEMTAGADAPTQNVAHEEGKEIMDNGYSLLLSRYRGPCHTSFEDNGAWGGWQLRPCHIYR